MEYENFVFYGSFLKTVDSIPDKELKAKVLEAIVRYGCSWQLPDQEKEPMVYAFLQMAIPNIDKQKDSYANGSKGGRPVTYTQEEYNNLFEQGLKNTEVAEKLGVSSSTVDRKKKIWKESKQKETEKENEKEKETEKEKESEVMGFWGVLGPQDNKPLSTEENFKTIDIEEYRAPQCNKYGMTYKAKDIASIGF